MSGTRALRLVLAVIIGFPVLRPLPAYSWHGSGYITALAIDPQNPAIIYAGTTDRGVFKSTNRGDSWSATGLTNISVGALAIDPQNSSILYAGTSGGVYKSTDGGGNWSATGPVGGPVFAVAIDSQTPSTLYAGTSVGVFKSTNGGGTWNATGLTTSPPDSSLLALAIARQNPTILYAGVGYVAYAWDEVQWSEVVKSTDGGASWSSTTLGAGYLDWVRIQTVVIGPQDPAIVYAGTDTDWAGVSKSLDGGTT